MNTNVLPPASPSVNSGRPSLARKFRYYLEAAGFFTVIGFFRLFGIDRASAVGGWVGRNLVSHTPMSRRARANLTAAYPAKSAAEIGNILNGMWDNLGRVLGEYAHLDKLHWRIADPRIEVEGVDHVDAAVAKSKGIIFVAAHFANWEILPLAARDYGLSGASVVRPANNPYVNRWLEDVRGRNGLAEMIPKGASGTRRIFSLLRKGEIVCMLVDQRASEGVLVPFFGREAQTTAAPAALALKLGCTILPVSNERVGGAHFRLRVYPPIPLPDTGDADRDLLELTAAITQWVEDRIRERPEQWLWIHKRWVDDPLLRKRAQTLSPGRGGTTSATSNRV